jgi:NAD(P)H-hydrate epimerase
MAFGAVGQWLEAQRGNPRAFIIDGLFGIGLNRALDGEWLKLVEAVNRSGIRTLAVDVPSGLNPDTGEPQGAAIEAAITVTLGNVKTGLVRDKSARWVGRLELAHAIGLVPSVLPTDTGVSFWTLPSDFAGFPPRRPADAHKGTFGHVAVLAGSLGYHGAGVLAAQGALRARPGLVTVFTDERCYEPVAAQLRAAMVRPWNGERIQETEFSAIVAGPGLASPGLPPAVIEETRRLWRSAAAIMVVDASALNWITAEGLDSAAGPRVITPHPGEAAGLLGTTSTVVQDDRLHAVRALAGRWEGSPLHVVLKGRHTAVGGNRGPVFINSSGNPGMAQGGTGDILAGYLAGNLAQPSARADISLAIRYAVWRHGNAADSLDEPGFAWTTEDLAHALSAPV